VHVFFPPAGVAPGAKVTSILCWCMFFFPPAGVAPGAKVTRVARGGRALASGDLDRPPSALSQLRPAPPNIPAD